MGSGENGKFTFLDMIAIISFLVGLENLDMNITQEDMDEESKRLTANLNQAVSDIHDHLAIQDMKLNIILEKLEGIENAGILQRQTE